MCCSGVDQRHEVNLWLRKVRMLMASITMHQLSGIFIEGVTFS